MNSAYLAVLQGVMLDGDTSITKFIQTLGDQIQIWGKLIVFAIGGVMVIAGIYHVAKNLMSQGRGQANWAMTLLLIVIGGALMASAGGGWTTLIQFSNDSKTTLDNMASGKTEAGENADPKGNVILPGVITTYIAE